MNITNIKSDEKGNIKGLLPSTDYVLIEKTSGVTVDISKPAKFGAKLRTTAAIVEVVDVPKPEPEPAAPVPTPEAKP
jgi:hypothetical protein